VLLKPGASPQGFKQNSRGDALGFINVAQNSKGDAPGYINVAQNSKGDAPGYINVAPLGLFS